MSNTILKTKKSVSMRFDSELLEVLKIRAKECNRSVSNYVECLLFDVVYSEPNEETKKAIKEAKRGNFAVTLDMSSKEEFMKSVMSIE